MGKNKKFKRKKRNNNMWQKGHWLSKESDVARFGTLHGFKVVFDEWVYRKIMHWVEKATGECSGLAVLCEQSNSTASTEMTAESVGKTMFELRNEPGQLNFWWHSHGDMACFWSGTDTDTIQQIGQHGWCLATVFNKKGDQRTAYYQKATENTPALFLDELDFSRQYTVPKEFAEAWDKDFDAKCKAKTYGSWIWDKEKKTWTDEKIGTGDDLADFEFDENYGYIRKKEDDKKTIPPRPDSDDDLEDIQLQEDLNYGHAGDDDWDEESLDNFAVEMETTADDKLSRSLLNRICRLMGDSAKIPDSKKANLKLSYIDRYNKSRAHTEGTYGEC
jgi:hypothetical protein